MNKSADEQVVKSCNIYQFNISLRHIKPRIWRRIQVPGDYNFQDLHYAIQDAMGWKDCHLHQFEMINPKTENKDLITAPDPDYTYDFPIVLEDKAKIAEYFLFPKDKAIYEYDLGDSWAHDIVLEQILPAVTYPQCLAGKGACPKEDDDRLCYSSTDKFDPKSVTFNKRACQGNRLCPPEDCEEVDRRNDFNAGDSNHKLIRSSNDADLNRMNKAAEAYPLTDCRGVDSSNDFNPKLIRLSNDVDSNTVNKATKVRLIKRACPPTDCGGVDRGNNFNLKLIRLSNDADSNTVNKATEVRLIKRVCPPTDCGGVDRGNNFNPKLIRLGNDADLNKMNKATEASLNNRACQTEDCGVVNGSININSKDPEVIRRSIAEYLYSRDKATRQNNNAKDFDPKLTRLSNDVGSNSVNETREEQVVKSCKIYQFKIILHHFKPKIWRRVQVPGEYSFKELHKVIQKAMGWSNTHLHQFTMKSSKTRKEEFMQVLLDPDYDFGVIKNERETKIAEHFLAPKATAIYEYDLGASWKHDIVLEKILPAVASITYPRCLAGRRKTPIEHPTESEQEDEELFYPTNEEKFDPKSVNFS